MNESLALELVRQTLITAFWMAAPLLLLSLVSGVVLSLVQILTSIQDPAFAAIPRLAVFVAGLLLLLPWMMHKLMSFTSLLFASFPQLMKS
jgi:flagellar biosynthesis protein FliQ